MSCVRCLGEVSRASGIAVIIPKCAMRIVIEDNQFSGRRVFSLDSVPGPNEHEGAP